MLLSDTKYKKLAEQASKKIPWWKLVTKLKLLHEIRFTNTKYKKIERAFLYQSGLDGRPWFKHVIFAPGVWTGYAGAVFPGLDESIDKEDYVNAERWIRIIDDSIKAAAKITA